MTPERLQSVRNRFRFCGIVTVLVGVIFATTAAAGWFFGLSRSDDQPVDPLRQSWLMVAGIVGVGFGGLMCMYGAEIWRRWRSRS